MRYTIVTIEWLTQHGLLALPTMRSNADGTKVVLHEEFVNLSPKDSFPTYRMDDPEFVQIMESEEWNYGAQNETYIEGWEKKTSNLLIYKRLCKI